MNAPARRTLLPPQATSSWWAPPTLVGFTERRTLSGFHYVVVDEIVGASVGLTLTAWPTLDELGRLYFRATGAYLVGSPIDELQAFLGQHRLPEELRERPLRIGDVFALRVRPEAMRAVAEELEEPQRLEPFLHPEHWIEPPLYDVTADARDAAKVAYYAAVTPTLDASEAAELQELRV